MTTTQLAATATLNAVRAGLFRARIEVRQSVPLILNYTFFPLISLLAMYFLRSYAIAGTGFSLGGHAIPGILAMNVLFTGLMGFATSLMMERQDGTLLRARATPNGILGYLVGKIASQAAMVVITLTFVSTLAAILFDNLRSSIPAGIGTLLWVVPLGLFAMLPLGAVLGSALPSPRYLSYVSLLLMGLVSVSGVFYPLALQSTWLQFLGQAFPLYWMGLGMRSAMLPGDIVHAEIGGSWRPLETVAVLGLWGVVGVMLAMIALRHTARRQSGKKMVRQHR